VPLVPVTRSVFAATGAHRPVLLPTPTAAVGALAAMASYAQYRQRRTRP
jgi:hypothetical protein